MATAGRAQAAKSPQLPLMVAAGLIGVTVLATSLDRLTGTATNQPMAPATAQRNLRFADRADGAVIVTLADTDRVLDIMTGQNGFLRGTLRGFARTRRAERIGPTPPLRLTGYADGRLILLDPSTGRTVELEAFGRDNEAVFARLLTKAPAPDATSPGRS